MKKFNIKKKEILIDFNKKPEGKNNLSSRASFLQRKLYEQKIQTNPIFNKNKPIDFLYENLFFGRLKDGLNGVTLQLKKENLKSIPKRNETVLALNIVVDAFIEFKKEWVSLTNKGGLSRESELLFLEVKKGFVDPSIEYYNMMIEYYNIFVKYIKETNKDKKILNFQSFLNVFIDFFEQQVPTFPFTYSSFIVSKMGTPHFTGLVLDLKEEDVGNDQIKIKKFLDDKNFEIFRTVSQRHGFNIDKNIPWRLVFNIDSVANKHLLEKYNLKDSNHLFTEYFEKANQYDVVLLKTYLKQMYQTYVFNKDIITKPVLKLCGSRIEISIETIIRESNKDSMEDNQEKNTLWKLYVFILSRERNLLLSQDHFDNIIKNTLSLGKELDEGLVLGYITAKVGASTGKTNRKEKTHRLIL